MVTGITLGSGLWYIFHNHRCTAVVSAIRTIKPEGFPSVEATVGGIRRSCGGMASDDGACLPVLVCFHLERLPQAPSSSFLEASVSEISRLLEFYKIADDIREHTEVDQTSDGLPHIITGDHATEGNTAVGQAKNKVQYSSTDDHTIPDLIQPLPEDNSDADTVHGLGKSETASGFRSLPVVDDLLKAARTRSWLKQTHGLEGSGADIHHEDSVDYSASERGNERARPRSPPLPDLDSALTWLRFNETTPVGQEDHAPPDSHDIGHNTTLTAIESKRRELSRLKWLGRHTNGAGYYHTHSGRTARKSSLQLQSLSVTDPVHPRVISPSPLAAKQEHTPAKAYLPQIEVDNHWTSDQPHPSAEATGSVTCASNPRDELTSPKDAIWPASGNQSPGNHFPSPTVEPRSEEVAAPTADSSDSPTASLNDPKAVLKQCKEELLEEARTWNALSEKALKAYMSFDAADDCRALKIPSPRNIEKEWKRIEQLVATRSGRVTEPMRVYGRLDLKDLNTLRFWVNLNQHKTSRGPHLFPPGYNSRFGDLGGDMSTASTVFSESEGGVDH